MTSLRSRYKHRKRTIFYTHAHSQTPADRVASRSKQMSQPSNANTQTHKIKELTQSKVTGQGNRKYIETGVRVEQVPCIELTLIHTNNKNTIKQLKDVVIFDPSIINVKPYVGIKELCTRTQETYFQLKFGLRQFQEGRLGYILGFVVIVQRQEIGEGRDTRGRSVFTHEYNSCSQLTSLLL